MPDYLAWPHDLLTLAAWDGLPEDALPRCELVEGTLHVTPSPLVGHARWLCRIARWFDDVLPPGLEFLQGQDLLCDPDPTPTVRRPDVMVVRAGLPDDTKRVDPADVVGVVEILSPGTRRTDRVAKVYDYAEAGIGWYVVVDPDSTALTLFVLPAGGGAYDCVARDAPAVDLPGIGRLDVGR
jgi:Uma2 family endonuclease